jgi:ribose transport system ATP-binding protein
MNHGRVVAVLDRADCTKERIMTAAAGTAREPLEELTNGAST